MQVSFRSRAGLGHPARHRNRAPPRTAASPPAAGGGTRYIGAWHIGGWRSCPAASACVAAHLAAQEGGDLAHADRAHHRRERGQIFASSSERTSSIPSSEKIFSNRSSQRAWSQSRGGSRMSGVSATALADAADLLRLPVRRASGRSSGPLPARARSRVVSPGRIRAAAAGSSRASASCASADRQRAHRRAHRRVDLGHRRDPLDQGADVEAGAADQDRQPARLVRLGDLAAWRPPPSPPPSRDRRRRDSRRGGAAPAPRPPRPAAPRRCAGRDRPGRCRR